MPGLMFGTVVDPSLANTGDGASANPLLGRANDLIVSELHGKYFQQTYRGNIYFGSTSTTGVVIPIATTKTPVYTIWNPAGSGKLCVPIVTLFGWVATAAALGTLVWMGTTNAGSTTGATAPIVSFTSPTTPQTAQLGYLTKKSVMNFGNDATTISITAAATMYRGTGITTIVTGTGLNSVNQPWFVARDDWDGGAIIPPGNAIHLMGATAVAVTAHVTTVWAEIPL